MEVSQEGGWIGTWSPGIGDPTVVGWVTVVAYLGTTYVAWKIYKKTPQFLREARQERSVWAAITLLFLALGINKQLDLQTAVTETGRIITRYFHVYSKRSRYQQAFVLGVTALSFVAAAMLAHRARHSSIQARIACAGAALVLGFVVVRAASFHDMDTLLRTAWLGVRWNWTLELGGISIVLFAALSRARALGALAAHGPRKRRRR
jgi:hypothetical protein